MTSGLTHIIFCPRAPTWPAKDIFIIIQCSKHMGIPKHFCVLKNKGDSRPHAGTPCTVKPLAILSHTNDGGNLYKGDNFP